MFLGIYIWTNYPCVYLLTMFFIDQIFELPLLRTCGTLESAKMKNEYQNVECFEWLLWMQHHVMIKTYVATLESCHVTVMWLWASLC